MSHRLGMFIMFSTALVVVFILTRITDYKAYRKATDFCELLPDTCECKVVGENGVYKAEYRISRIWYTNWFTYY